MAQSLLDCNTHRRHVLFDLWIDSDLHWLQVINWLDVIKQRWENWILHYRDNPILTTYSVVTAPLGLDFPEIYICPISAVHQGARREANPDPEWESMMRVEDYFKATAGQFGIATQGDTIIQQKTRLWDIILRMQPLPYGPHDGTTTPPNSRSWIPNDIQDYFLRVSTWLLNWFFCSIPLCMPINRPM